MLDDLKLFLSVAASGSFTRAATLAGTTQPAVSKRIHALEQALSATLFERTGRGARLTEAGRALVPRAEALTNSAATLADALASDVMEARGTVRVAIQPSVAWPLVRDLFVRLRETHPAVHLEVAEAPTGQIATWLRDGRHDVGVLNQPGQELLPNVEPLFAPPLLLISRAGDPVTRRTTVPFARLARLRLVTSVMPNGGRVLLEETARQRGVDPRYRDGHVFDPPHQEARARGTRLLDQHDDRHPRGSRCRADLGLADRGADADAAVLPLDHRHATAFGSGSHRRAGGARGGGRRSACR